MRATEFIPKKNVAPVEESFGNMSAVPGIQWSKPKSTKKSRAKAKVEMLDENGKPRA